MTLLLATLSLVIDIPNPPARNLLHACHCVDVASEVKDATVEVGKRHPHGRAVYETLRSASWSEASLTEYLRRIYLYIYIFKRRTDMVSAVQSVRKNTWRGASHVSYRHGSLLFSTLLQRERVVSSSIDRTFEATDINLVSVIEFTTGVKRCGNRYFRCSLPCCGDNAKLPDYKEIARNIPIRMDFPVAAPPTSAHTQSATSIGFCGPDPKRDKMGVLSGDRFVNLAVTFDFS